MIDFLYKLDYEDHRYSAKPRNQVVKFSNMEYEVLIEYRGVNPDPPTEYDSNSLIVNMKVYIITNKYEVQALKEYACIKYK